ncbi:hypothetical protein AKJ09_02655 [Labilithrix luteola]|uniref:Uncharacterized protein n=1 Tax=Labilithrix luteola TaxID=1391654 RepID=A0A0K1PRI6_9BACT|nr:hypothetical protein AKJ09_02655 [Labilithrix luteola]
MAVLAIVGVFTVACGSSDRDGKSSGALSQDADGGAPEASTRSFDPRGLDRSCTKDEDCELVSRITDCTFVDCCVRVAVKRTSELEAAMQLDGCSGQFSGCSMKCPKVSAICVSGQCDVAAEIPVDPDGGAQ